MAVKVQAGALDVPVLLGLTRHGNSNFSLQSFYQSIVFCNLCDRSLDYYTFFH